MKDYREYSERWDSYYWPTTGEWAEKECSCSAEECEYAGRPEKWTPECEKAPWEGEDDEPDQGPPGP